MEGLGLFIAASVGLTVAASKRQQHAQWKKAYRDKKREEAEKEAALKQEAEKKAAQQRNVMATRKRQQRERDTRVYRDADNKAARIDFVYDWIARDLSALYERDVVRDIVQGLAFELDADFMDYDFGSDKMSEKAIADKQTWPEHFYWLFAFLVCRNTNLSRSEPDCLEGLVAAKENYPGDKIIMASIIHVLSVTVFLLLEMPLAFVIKEQTNFAKNWSEKGIDREWLAMEWKRCAMKRIKVQWTAVVIDFVALAPVTPAVRHHADALLAALEAEDVDSDGEGDSEFVDGVYLHYKKKCKV
jgi:hypothetical protein